MSEASLPTRGVPYTPWISRYSTVDAWRGLAALGVAAHHMGYGHGFNLGHNCVMVFFVISGYCIASSSDSCLRNGLGFREFMWRRIRRIYPPYFFALCFFLLSRVVKLYAGFGDQFSRSIVAWIQTFTITQWLYLPFHPTSYAHRNPHLFVASFWSLNYEEQFYLTAGLLMLVATWSRKSLLWGVLALIVPAFVLNLLQPSMSYGFFLEYWVHFGVGVLVYYRLCKIHRRFWRTVIDAGLVFLVVFSLLRWPHGMNHMMFRSVYVEWTATGTFALLLIALRRWDEAMKQSRLGTALCAYGLITYSLYLTHQFNERVAFTISGLFIRHGVPQFLKLTIELAVLSCIAFVFWYLCERPFLNKAIKEKKVAMAEEPALCLVR